MASKLGFMLSSIFLVFVLLSAGDLLCLSQVRAVLNNLAVTVAYRISKDGYVSNTTKSLIADYGATYVPVTKGFPSVGESYTFRLTKEYKPLIMSKNAMVITVSHTAIVGFYDSYY